MHVRVMQNPIVDIYSLTAGDLQQRRQKIRNKNVFL